VGNFWLLAGDRSDVVFLSVLGAVSASARTHLAVLNYCQALWLHWMMLGVVIALVIWVRLFRGPSSTPPSVSSRVVGILLVGGHLNQVALQRGEPLRSYLPFTF